MYSFESTESEEKKDITIRGVNKELYDTFSEMRIKQGISTGEAFDSLVTIYLKQPWKIHGLRRFGHQKLYGVKPEIISDIDHLRISRNDLTAAGDKTMFLFRHIQDLTFEKDVDGQTIAKHVKFIGGSNVTFLGQVPTFIQSGVTRKKVNYLHPQNNDDLKDITIRNVSVNVYDEFSSKAKSEGKTTGEYFSELLADHIPLYDIFDFIREFIDREILIVKHEKELQISSNDLQILGDRGVIFYRINKLIFDKDINQELFLKTVLKIVKCDDISLPSNIPKLIALSRIAQNRVIHTGKG